MQGQGAAQGGARAGQADAAVSSRFVVSPGEVLDRRLRGIERFELTAAGHQLAVCAALPPAYAKSRRRRYPLLILHNAGELLGAAIEMSRLLAASGEVAACIVVNIDGGPDADAGLLSALVGDCSRRYRIQLGQVAVYAHGDAAHGLLRAFDAGIQGVTRCILATTEATPADAHTRPGTDRSAIAWSVLRTPPPPAGIDAIRWKQLPESTAAGLVVPALLHGLRAFWARDHQYGDEVVALSHPWVAGALRALSPLLRPLTRRREFPADTTTPQVLRSEAMARDFEVFVALPESAARHPQRLYPAVVVLDANGCFATVSDIARRLARAGDISEAIIIGIGTPHSQGDLEFAFRRFEELSPPASADYRWDDALGRFFRSAFALRGQDARKQLGQAAGFHQFINRELLPQLIAELPIDRAALQLIGHSAAGTYVAYELAQPGSLFDGYLCLSPGVAIGGNWMMQHAPSADRGSAQRLFVAVGAQEMSNRFNGIAGIPQTPAWVEMLRRNRGPAAACHLLEGETHTTVYARAVVQGLCQLLGKNTPAQQPFSIKSSQ